MIRESAHAHVEAVVRPGNDGVLASLPPDADWDTISTGIRANSIGRHQRDHATSTARLASIVEQANQLKRNMVTYRNEIEARKRLLIERRSRLDQKKKELSQYRAMHLEPAEFAVRKTRQRVHRLSQRYADAKANLCFTTSTLLSLKQEIDPRRKATGRIMLAGLVIPDLRETNGPIVGVPSVMSNDESDNTVSHINACLDNVSRLIAVWTHYLTISVPSEILLPHDDFPHAGILTEKASYRERDISYPGSTSQNTSPTTSRIINEVQNLPRPRILRLDRPLSRLAKEEPKTFGLFVEGLMLLAWDVAWLCRTQGILSINTFDDVCDIGRNLWLLHRAAELRTSEATTHQIDHVTKGKTSSRGMQFGKLTHGTVSHALTGHEGAAMLQSWRLAQPQHLIDKLRSFLLAEMSRAEWDVLSDKDFDESREDEIAVLVGGDRTVRYDGNMSIMSVAPVKGNNATTKAEKGWMKVRDRVTGDS